MREGTRVENQAEPRIEGTVTGESELSGFVIVTWDDGRVFDEQIEDVTPIDDLVIEEGTG